ncbi:zf-HC2 domain-containing protein [candidate division KSB1 bacterium]|nr:zf-HC2 domain-containing protein [candidate division KSB1 bacterium]
MKHLKAAEVVLFLKSGGLDEQEKNQMTNHLKSCTVCKKMIDEMELSLRDTAQVNLNECHTNLLLLPDYLEGALFAPQKKAIETHLKECERCRLVLNWLEDWPDWENLANQPVQIPAEIRTRIEHKVLKKLAFEKAELKNELIHDKVTKKAEAAIHVLRLIFRPIEPDFAFRESDLKVSRIVEHGGGDLKLKTGLPDVLVELTSVFEDFQINSRTDRNGEVFFSQLNRGDYLVQVPGFELEKIIVEALHER